MEKVVNSRTTKSMRNVIVGFVSLALSLLIQFISRSVFIDLLGREFNGINGMFSSILNVLSLAELGFAFSVAYILYKPLKEGDEKTVSAIMNFFAKIYRVIAVIVLVAGCAVIPVLQYLIKGGVANQPFSLNQLRIYFALFLSNTVCSYLLAYKRTIVTADQNSYIVSLVDNFGNIALYIMQTVLLLIFKNYYAYLGTLIAKTILNNVIITIIANKKYPYLRKYRKLKLEKELRTEIFKNVQASFCHRVGNVINTGTTALVLSAFVGDIEAGIYSNYLMIISGVNMFINMIFNSITASVGNLCISGRDDDKYRVFKRVRYMANFIAVFTFTCYICLFNAFVPLWLDEQNLFPMSVVIAMSASTMIGTLRKPVNTFKDAQGLFKKDWYKPIVEAAVGISLAIGLSYVLGVLGIVLGYTISTICIAIPIENIVFFNDGIYGYNYFSKIKKNGKIKTRVVNYRLIGNIIFLIGTVLFAALVAYAGYYISSFIPLGWGWFIVRLVFAAGFSTAAFVLATFYTKEFKYYKGLAGRVFGKLFSKFKRKKIA